MVCEMELSGEGQRAQSAETLKRYQGEEGYNNDFTLDQELRSGE